MAVERFATDPFPLDRRAAAWDEALGASRLAAEAEPGPPSGLLLRHRAPRGTEILLIAGGPQRLIHGCGPRTDFVWLGALLDGGGQLPDGTMARERELFCWPSATGPLLAAMGRFLLLLLRLPRRDPCWGGLAEAAPRQGESAVSGRPGLHLGKQAVLVSMLETFAKAIETGSEPALAALEIALAEIMPAVLGSASGVSPPRAALRRRVVRAIEGRLDDPTLNLSRFAETEGFSVRAVQKLLADEGRNFSQFLRQRRLERAAETLADPRQRAVPIGEIGFCLGFTDPAHFSRAFRHRFGITPNAYRANALAHAGGTLAGAPPSRGYPGLATAREAPPQHHSRPPAAARRNAPAHHHLRAAPETVHWGYFSRSLPPVLTVRSEDLVTVETLTQHASDDPARMIEGDPGAQAVFHWTAGAKAVDRRGAGPIDASIYGRGAGEGFGVHILTGPIAVEEARPGDVLEVEILDIVPRQSQAPGYRGRSFGSNAAAWWGRHYDDLLTGPKPREVVTLYEIGTCEGGPCAHAVYSFRWTPQRDPSGVLHETIDYPGVPVNHATIETRHGVLDGVHIPLRPHFGTIGLAPDHPVPLDSVPPSSFGGNIDNWRLGAGSKLFLPVSLPGAMLSIGDPHAAQGDGEIGGTAIECSLTGTLRLRLHPKKTAGAMLRDITYPLIETPESWIIQGFSQPDYLADLGGAAQSEIYRRSSLDTAMRDAFRKARRFLMTAQALSEDEAISLLSVAVDFGITQVVDGNWGVHATVPKAIFSGRRSPNPP